MKKIKTILAGLLITPMLLMSTVSFTKTVEPQTLSLEIDPIPGTQPTGIYVASSTDALDFNYKTEDNENIHAVKTRYGNDLHQTYSIVAMKLLINKTFFMQHYSYLHVNLDLSYNAYNNDEWLLKNDNQSIDIYNSLNLNFRLKGYNQERIIWTKSNLGTTSIGKNLLYLGEKWEDNYLTINWKFLANLGLQEDRGGSENANFLKIKNPHFIFNNIE